jgi:hypothetical protein
MSPQAVMRHRDQHLPPEVVRKGERDVEAQDAERGEDLSQTARLLRKKAISLLVKAEQSGDLRTALVGIREAARLLEVQGRLEGQIDSSTTVNVNVSAQFLSIQATILQALAPFPEARLAVVQALTAIEGDVVDA